MVRATFSALLLIVGFGPCTVTDALAGPLMPPAGGTLRAVLRTSVSFHSAREHSAAGTTHLGADGKPGVFRRSDESPAPLPWRIGERLQSDSAAADCRPQQAAAARERGQHLAAREDESIGMLSKSLGD